MPIQKKGTRKAFQKRAASKRCSMELKAEKVKPSRASESHTTRSGWALVSRRGRRRFADNARRPWIIKNATGSEEEKADHSYQPVRGILFPVNEVEGDGFNEMPAARKGRPKKKDFQPSIAVALCVGD